MLRFYDCIGFLASYKEKQVFSDLCVMFFSKQGDYKKSAIILSFRVKFHILWFTAPQAYNYWLSHLQSQRKPVCFLHAIVITGTA
jgi:hypothetical protein